MGVAISPMHGKQPGRFHTPIIQSEPFPFCPGHAFGSRSKTGIGTRQSPFAILAFLLTLESMDVQEALAFWEATKFSRWQRRHNRLTTKRASKDAKKAFRALARKRQRSMMHMGAERFHKVPVSDERTKALFRAHLSRREAGWIRG